MTSPADAEPGVDLESILSSTIESPQLRDAALWSLKRLRQQNKMLLNLAETGWGVVANVWDWDAQSQEWRAAAERWRDRYHAELGAALAQAGQPE